MYEAMYGAGTGYAEFDIADVGTAGLPGEGPTHTSFIVWLIVYSAVALAILGALNVGGFKFVFSVK